jgi:hypothetical protein
MPLIAPESFAGGDEKSQFCIHCVNADGSPKPCAEVFAGGVDFFLRTIGGERALAERITRRNMRQLPYWQGKDCPDLEGEAATDEEFDAVLSNF